VAWCYPEPLPGAQAIKGNIAFAFHRMDHWFEEDQEIFEHPRDPYHRIDIYPRAPALLTSGAVACGDRCR
jgi:uncharacterized protein (DUF427 family)